VNLPVRRTGSPSYKSRIVISTLPVALSIDPERVVFDAPSATVILCKTAVSLRQNRLLNDACRVWFECCEQSAQALRIS
jgi:hypothetical protein